MNQIPTQTDNWLSTTPEVFWGEIAPCEHVMQIYEDNETFLSMLESFAANGFASGECVIVIATPAHLKALNERLAKQFDIFNLTLSDDYIPLNAEKVLEEFVVNDWPDENLFLHVVGGLLARGKKKNRKVRAFGEMVAILWAKGMVGATVRLEHLWNNFCSSEAFSLFCAYPKSGFTQDTHTSILSICEAHSKMINGAPKTSGNVFYTRLNGNGEH